jgi:hypothetical protein
MARMEMTWIPATNANPPCAAVRALPAEARGVRIDVEAVAVIRLFGERRDDSYKIWVM